MFRVPILTAVVLCAFAGAASAQMMAAGINSGNALVSDATIFQTQLNMPVVYGSDTSMRWTSAWDPFFGRVYYPVSVPDDQQRTLRLAGQPSAVGMTDRLSPPTIIELNRSMRQQEWPAIQPEGVNMTKHLTTPTVIELNRRLRAQAREKSLPIERAPSPNTIAPPTEIGGPALNGHEGARAEYGVRWSRTR